MFTLTYYLQDDLAAHEYSSSSPQLKLSHQFQIMLMNPSSYFKKKNKLTQQNLF